MISQCWLHIGTEKTGSTSIQAFLAQNRPVLLSRGWLYPNSAGRTKQYSLAAFALDDHRSDRVRRLLGAGQRLGVDEFRRRLSDSLKAEAAASGARAMVLSSELLSTQLRRPGEIAHLKSLCDALAQETKVVVYLRNQADFLVSRYTNVIWEGGTADFGFRARAAIADYALLLERWSHVFGRTNMIVRRFEPMQFVGDDVVEDFAQTIGLDMRGLRRPARSNPSLDAQSLAFLRAVNRQLPPHVAKHVDRFRGALVRVLQRRGGTKFVITRALAERIESAYRDSNARVSAEYFGSRSQPLFSPPVLVSRDVTASPNRLDPITATRIAGFLALGLLRDGVLWAARRLNHVQ